MSNGLGGDVSFFERDHEELAKEIARKKKSNGTGGGGEEPPWGKPDLSLLDVDAISPPPFPEVLPAGWRQWAKAASEGAGCPIDYVALSLLASVSTMIGNARWGQPWANWKESPALFVGLVGRPSSGKSPGLDTMTWLLTRLQDKLNERWDETRLAYKRDLAAAKERRAIWEDNVRSAIKGGKSAPDMPADADDPKPPQRQRTFSTDPTIEKAAKLVQGNPRGLLLVRDELSGWIGGMDRYSHSNGGDRAFWLQAYGGRPWAPDRVKDGEDAVLIPHLLWGVCGGIQPDRIASQLLVGHDDDGLAARFIFGWPAAVPPRIPKLTANYDTAFDALWRLFKLSWAPPEPIFLPFTEDAVAALQALRLEAAEIEKETAGMFQSWVGKLPGFCIKLAIVIQHLEWCWNDDSRLSEPAQIELWAVEAAADFLEQYAVPMARRVFGEAAMPRGVRDSRALARWLIRQRPVPETVNARELRRMADGPGIPDSDRITVALEELAAANWVRESRSQAAGRGRKRDDWDVNPALNMVRR